MAEAKIFGEAFTLYYGFPLNEVALKILFCAIAP